jgi:hypothetical protein
MRLPPGFELEQSAASGMRLPPGFQIEQAAAGQIPGAGPYVAPAAAQPSGIPIGRRAIQMARPTVEALGTVGGAALGTAGAPGLGSLLGAGIGLVKYLADPYNQLPAITFWLLGSLAAELKHKTANDIGFRAQGAVDILVRNLFERTADIGFLAMDSDLCAFAERAALLSDEELAATRGGVLMRRRPCINRKANSSGGLASRCVSIAPSGATARAENRSRGAATSACSFMLSSCDRLSRS